MKRKKFWKVITREQARALFADLPTLEEETVEIADALGRVVARDIASQVDVPHFARASMDGFAVRARDTYGASEISPIRLKVVGEVAVGAEAATSISEGEALGISTGAMLPPQADAVLMVEYTHPSDGNSVELTRPVAPGENVSQIGEDIGEGTVILKRGKKIRPQDVAALASVGITQVSVSRAPRVGILSTGNELVPPGTKPKLGQVRGINSFSLSALALRYGACPVNFGIVRDSRDEIRDTLERAMASTDLVVISGGSSVGTQDLTLEVIQSLEGSGMLAHGLAVRPGKPTIIAKVKGKPIIGLPGHPASAMVVFSVLVKPIIHRMIAYSDELDRQRVVKARMSQNVASASGREDYVRVSLEGTTDELVARPVLGKSAAISTLVQADGLARIPLEKEGLEAGETVEVELW